MICGATQISSDQWVDYVEELAPAAESARIREHLVLCGECRKNLERLRLGREQLLRAAAREVRPENSALTRIWLNTCFRIRRFRGGEAPAQVDLTQLRSILVSMCGEVAAEGALIQAEAKGGAAMDPGFSRSLGSIVEVMCGARAARFVEHAAETARRSKVA